MVLKSGPSNHATTGRSPQKPQTPNMPRRVVTGLRMSLSIGSEISRVAPSAEDDTRGTRPEPVLLPGGGDASIRRHRELVRRDVRGVRTRRWGECCAPGTAPRAGSREVSGCRLRNRHPFRSHRRHRTRGRWHRHLGRTTPTGQATSDGAGACRCYQAAVSGRNVRHGHLDMPAHRHRRYRSGVPRGRAGPSTGRPIRLHRHPSLLRWPLRRDKGREDAAATQAIGKPGGTKLRRILAKKASPDALASAMSLWPTTWER